MSTRHTPHTLEELKKLRTPARNAHAEYRARLNIFDRMALYATERVGSTGFFFLLTAWSIGWTAWNTWGPVSLRFDPFPAFVLWLFVSNLLQLLLLPLLMVGQNLQNAHAEVRAQADFETNMQAARELEVILQHLENQDALLKDIAAKLDATK